MEETKHKPTASHASSQEEVVSTAFAMINEQGYAKFSIRALAEQLGIGTMSVYTYVPSKKQLLFLVLAKMREGFDNAPVAGEYWEDTLHRTCASIRSNSLENARVRLMQTQTQIAWPLEHNRNTFLLHADQGMPREVYDPVWSVLRAFLSGFIDREVAELCMTQASGEDPFDNGDWATICNDSAGEKRFHEGLDIIIAGTKTLPGAEGWRTWRTPENPADWQWGKE